MTEQQCSILEQARQKITRLNASVGKPRHWSGGSTDQTQPAKSNNDVWELAGMNWSRMYECGNPTIDQQHRQLCEQAHQLQIATLNGQLPAEILNLVNPLLDKVTRHFRDEENILRQAFFPHTAEHRQLHATIIATATALVKQYEQGKFGQSDLISFLIYDVLLWHMLEEDRQFFAFLDPDFPLTPEA